MIDLFSKLDLNDYIEAYEACLARPKPIFLEGDTRLHFALIAELQNRTFNAPPQVKNLETPLVHLTKQGILRLSEIYEFIKIIRYMSYLQGRQFEGKTGDWLDKILIPDTITPIVAWFDDEGNLKDSVDERFGVIKAALASVKERMQTQLRQLFSTKRLEGYLVDRQVHYMNNQEALLVRGGFNHVLKGTVIGRSSSGFFYVVPEALDGLKRRESELIDQQEEIIFEYAKRISGEFHKKQPFLKFINKEFDRFDAYHARIIFARSRNMEFIIPDREPIIQLKDFRHPALHDPKPVSLNFKGQVLMVTGVNAGGKTMLLKSILSSVLMAKYLLPMPINAAHSKIGTFKNIEAIIEDPQNVKNDISTFAGRMVQFGQLFGKKNILVGVDEIELGTDADEAASLFKVVIEQLMKQGIKLVITTHHKRLASLLATHDEVELLAALYDERNQKPTFEFLHGTIGKSYAFETAERYGIPASIIGKAREVYGEDKEKLGELIQKNIDLELAMKQRLRDMESDGEKVAKLKRQLEEQKEDFEQQFRKRQRELEIQYNEAINVAKTAAKATGAQETHRELNRAHAAKKLIATAKPVQQEPIALKVGDKIKYGKSKGVLKGIKKEQATIECDGITLRVPLHTLKRSGNNPPPVAQKTKIDIERTGRGGIKLDLHGLRADEAIDKLDKFISDALLNGFDEVLVYHGIGTGKLAYAVKTFLKSHPSVQSYVDAPPSLGGFGATVVTL